ncbi:site-specific integrase [Flammeovirga pacifica]|uniref:Tyr recombinase domain-containing protein n=1 Tax=Flammeovirga pacifica TaxID=915059 RepID=A0A1S1Z0E9_FLAPC|nr:site-specific integrase [Flammeovirga pacifica]OHX66736.1 hypothetical protein NH26_10385 [Flammeovirga pacifica]
MINNIESINLNVSFYTRKLRNYDRKGLISINARVTLNKIRSGFATGIIVHKNHWNTNRFVNCPNADILNESLFLWENRIRSVTNRLIQTNEFVSVYDVVNYSKDNLINFTIEKILNDYFNNRKNLWNKERQNAIQCMQRRILKMLSKRKIIDARELTVIKLEDCYLDRISNGSTHRVIMQDISYLRRAIDYFANKNRCYYVKVGEITISRKVKDQIHFLSNSQLKKIENLNLIRLNKSNNEITLEKFYKAQKWFLFACYTGMHFNEIKKFSSKKHVKYKNGIQYIEIFRDKTKNKTNKPCIIPLIQKAKDLLNYFDGNHINDFYSSTNIRYYTLKIGEELNLDFKLTHKIGRKTFGTLMLLRGMSVESVSKMLGHSEINTTQRFYATVLEERIFNEFEKLSI